MILRDRDRTVDLCCDNVVGLVSGDLWPAIVFILCFVYFDHNGRSALTGCPRWPRSSTRKTSLHGFTKRDCVNKFFFFLTEGNKKNWFTRSNLVFRFKPQPEISKSLRKDGASCDMQNEKLGFLFASRRTRSGRIVKTTNKALLWRKTFSLFSVKREMPILFFVNCERTVLFSVKRDLDPPFTTLWYVVFPKDQF